MKKNHIGFTLTELLTAVSISTIILIIAGMIIRSSISSWKRGQRKIGLDNDAAYAVSMMERHLRESSRVEIAENGERIDIFTIGNDSPVRSFYKSNDNLMTENLVAGTSMYIISEASVTGLTFSTGTINTAISLELSLRDEEKNLDSTSRSTIEQRLQY